jgi:tRNA 5-methylaminomethyl-2-thiouridine biosynthesis bifunctional protein
LLLHPGDYTGAIFRQAPATLRAIRYLCPGSWTTAGDSVAETPFRIVPAAPAFDANGTPYSPGYGDVYHSAESGPGQAQHVFLGGNGLPAGWSGARFFTVLETGFGFGLNFLATWQAWREDPARPERLHFVSVEKHPFEREGLAALHARYAGFAPLAVELQAAWPLPLPGLHRLHFEGGRVTLTVAFAQVADILPKLRLVADAIFLDGFAPDRNPDMWALAVMKALARLARPGTTAATYTTARAVRDALAAAGFAAELRPGFGRKRQMLVARYAPMRPARRTTPSSPQWNERRAVVVGAGLAGAAVCERLAARGWAVELVERHAGPALDASGMPAGTVHPQVSRDDSILSRLTRAGFLYALGNWQALEAAGHDISWQRCGVLQLAKDARDEARMAATVRALGFPAAYVDFLPRATTGTRVGIEVNAGGWWFAGSGWTRPSAVVNAQLAAARTRGAMALHYNATAHALARDGELWRVLDAGGGVIASAPVVVLANSHDAARLARLGTTLKRVRGQLTFLPEGCLPRLRAVLAGPGHLIPAGNGAAVAGATYDYDDEDETPSEDGHAGNLARVERLLKVPRTGAEPSRLTGAVGFRCVAPDRLPLIGALPDMQAARPGAQAILRLHGLYGALAYASRGSTWAALGGELIASLLEGEPLPLEGDLADAVDPARFALRRVRRGGFRV